MHISKLIEILSNPDFYPHATTPSIRVIQTQMSVIFITGELVYKIKKPINLGYLDYSKLEDRKYFCEQEVTLNQRLSPDAYLNVLPITQSADGAIALDGEGEIIEYAVKMKYLPQEKMLNVMLEQNSVTPQMMKSVAALISDFHRKAESNAEISAIASLETQEYNAEENFSQLAPYIDRVLTQSMHDKISSFGRNYLKSHADIFTKRNKSGKIRDCHGDLHSQHICFTDPIAVYDCIEFTNRFRCIDVAAEVSFLCMDLDHSGHGDLSLEFLKEYIDKSKDAEIISLSRYYKAYYACVRGKVNCFQLDDELLSDEAKEKCKATAKSYVNLALSNSHERPFVLINSGTSGCGKTTVSLELAKKMGLCYLSSDIIRKNIYGINPTDHSHSKDEDGLYSSETTRKTFDTLYNKAEEALKYGYSVILDATFLTSDKRQSAYELAKRNNCDYYVIEHVIDEKDTLSNLKDREKAGTVSDATFDIYKNQTRYAEPVTEIDESHIIRLNAKLSVADKLNIIMDMVNNG